jgi:hypothetical protein
MKTKLEGDGAFQEKRIKKVNLWPELLRKKNAWSVNRNMLKTRDKREKTK